MSNVENKQVISLTAPWAKNVAYLAQYRSFLIKVGVFALVVSTLIAFTLPKQYQSSTNLMPPEPQSGSAEMLAALAGRMGGTAGGGLGMLASGLLGAKSNGELYIDLLRSGSVTGSLANRYDLQHVYHTRYMKDTIKRLASRTQIVDSKKSGVITITVTDTDRQRAQDLARGYVEELNKLLTRVSTSSAGREREFIEQRRNSVLTELNSAEEQLSHFSSSTSTIDIREQTKATVDAGARIEAERIVGESELQSLRQVYGDDNIRVKSARERLAVLQNELGKIGGSEADAESATPLTLTKDQLYPPLRRLPELGVQYANLYRHVRVQEAVYELLSAEYESARIQEAKEIPSVSVIDPAGYPEKKSFPPRLVFMVLGTLFAELLTCGLLLCSRAWKARDEQDDLKQILQLLFGSQLPVRKEAP